MSRGYVYVLSNPSMPGLVKVGRSIHGGQGRADALYRNDTGVALPFKLEFEVLVEDAITVERQAHESLSFFRVNPRREFFRIDVCTAKIIISQLMLSEIGVHYPSHPDSVLIKPEWIAQESKINNELASKGYKKVDQNDFAVEVCEFAFNTEEVVKALVNRQDHSRKFTANKEASAVENYTGELH